MNSSGGSVRLLVSDGDMGTIVKDWRLRLFDSNVRSTEKGGKRVQFISDCYETLLSHKMSLSLVPLKVATRGDTEAKM